MDAVEFCEMNFVCSCCLRMDGNNLSLTRNYDGLLEAITGLQKTSSNGRWLCSWCISLLKKINNFRKICLESHYILLENNITEATNNEKRKIGFNLSHKRLKIFQTEREPSISNILCVDLKISGDETKEVQVTSFIHDGKLSKNVMEDMLVVSKQVKDEILCMEEGNIDMFDDSNIDYTPSSDSNDYLSIQDVVNKDRRCKTTVSEQTDDANVKVKTKRKENLDFDLKSEEIPDGMVRDDAIRCDFCNLTFTKSSRLVRHITKCKELLKKSPKKLRRRMKSKGNFINSLKTKCKREGKISKKDIKCKECGREFNLPWGLKRHEVIHSTSRPFSCSECSKTFRRKGDLKKHIIVHSGVKPYICDVCGDKFTALGNLNCHTLRKHSDERRYSCAKCGKKFKTDAELRRHGRVHTGERPYRCDVCGHSFALPGNLKTHLRIHSGERPYRCNICGNSFADAGYLKKHKRIHSGEKPYPCDLCALSFSTACGRKTHSAVHSLVKPFSCGDCSYSTSRSQHLKRHQKTHKAKLPN